MSDDSGEYLSPEHEAECRARDAIFERTWSEPEPIDPLAAREQRDVDIVVLTGAYPGLRRTVWEMFSDKDGAFDRPWSVPDGTSFPALLVDLGFFGSRSDARRNGWPMDIPDGFSQHTIGKFKRLLSIYKPF